MQTVFGHHMCQGLRIGLGHSFQAHNMVSGPGHAPTSPLPGINRAWRRITVAVIASAITYKVYRSYTRYGGTNPEVPPGAFTGSTGVEPAERKSKYQGAGNSYLGRRSGDKFN